jgi:hypothetical protein
MPICKPIINTAQQPPPRESLAHSFNNKLAALQRNCGKDFTLHAIVFNANLMKLIKRE